MSPAEIFSVPYSSFYIRNRMRERGRDEEQKKKQKIIPGEQALRFNAASGNLGITQKPGTGF